MDSKTKVKRCSEETIFIFIVAIFCSISCSGFYVESNNLQGRTFTEAEALFHQDSRWLGADAALSIPLGNDRTLWLFGDTFIATSDAGKRAESKMIRNSVAIQTGLDMCTASMSFRWGTDSDNCPASFFPERSELWYWPGHGTRIEGGPLIIFLYSMIAKKGQGLGFETAGFAVAVIDDPDAPLEKWKPRVFNATPILFDAVPATAVVKDGPYIVAVAIRQKGTHAGALVRYPKVQLVTGSVDGAEWWAGDERGWIPEYLLGESAPVFVIDDAGSECSLHWDKRTGSFIHIASYGFGASTIGLRTAPRLTGPWSDPVVVYHPPESSDPDPFVYAAKAHPELACPEKNDLVVTYATNSFEFGDLLTQKGEQSLYWPRVVRIRLVQGGD